MPSAELSWAELIGLGPVLGWHASLPGVAPAVCERVKEGDTFCSIAGCYGLSPSQVIKANSTVDDPDRIYPGDRIYIP
eukprot:jgi/Mesen1/5068/ME000252S04189